MLSRVGAQFPAGDGDDYASLCRRAKPDHALELEKLFADGEPTFDTVDALDTGGSWPKLKTLLRARSAREILVGLLAPNKEQEAALRDDSTWASEAERVRATHARPQVADERPDSFVDRRRVVACCALQRVRLRL